MLTHLITISPGGGGGDGSGGLFSGLMVLVIELSFLQYVVMKDVVM